MTQIYREDGTIVPVTMVKVEPCVVTQVKTTERDGYDAVQLGVGTKKHQGKSLDGHLKPIMATGQKPFHRLREIRLSSPSVFKIGDTLSAASFQVGDKIEAVGTSKGRGFQGVVKRHGFHGQPATRGTKDQERMPGSIASKRQGAVRKGQRMAGRMGGDRITIKNLQVVRVDADTNMVYVKGALPGARHGLVMLFGAGDMQASGNMLASKPVAEASAQVQPQPATA